MERVRKPLARVGKEELKVQASSSSPPAPASTFVRFGLGVVIAVFGGLLLWSIVAPIDGAVIAPGQVSVESNRKTIQHLEGGVVRLDSRQYAIGAIERRTKMALVAKLWRGQQKSDTRDSWEKFQSLTLPLVISLLRARARCFAQQCKYTVL